MADFNKVGLLFVRQDRVLLCRKNNFTSQLILPGGQLEAGESDVECLKREVHEELGGVALTDLSYLGTYEDRASADDPTVHKTVRIKLYSGSIVGDPHPSAEIIQLEWFGLESDWSELSPIIRNRVIPDLVERGLLTWTGASSLTDTAGGSSETDQLTS